jgi:ABC-type transport system involved in cytochrome c biogenesis permease subunit
MNARLFLLAFSASVGLLPAAPEPYRPWPEEVVSTFARIPVLDEGRVKPIQTVAHFTLLELRGRTTLPIHVGGEAHRLSASEWLLDAFFRPELAKDYPVFLVDDTAAVKTIGGRTVEKVWKPSTKTYDTRQHKKRGVFSYNDLLPGRAQLSRLASSYAQKQARKEPLSSLEEQILILGKKVNDFEFLLSSLGPAQPSRLVDAERLPEDMQRLAATMKLSGLLGVTPQLAISDIESMMRRDPETMSEDERQVQTALQLLYFLHRTGVALALFPPADPARAEWVSLGEMVGNAVAKPPGERSWELERLKLAEEAAAASADPLTFLPKLEALRAAIQRDADARNEASQIRTEIRLYDGKYLDNAKVFFIAAFVCIVLMWSGPMTSWGRISTVLAIWLGIFGFLYLVAGMALRSQIRGWAPITNLYETFLFISASSFVFGLIFERSNRHRIALSAAIFIPMLCMILSGQFLLISPEDTLPPLVAVLRSNFWLTTHVITITLGYSAGLLAAIIASFWILGRFFGWGRDRKDLYRDATRMTYGIVLFSLLFSLVGTVLGGIWANYSWGRFWGWDPKENGALMIVLWTLVILHARLGGYIREIGLHVCAVLLGVIISFSWFGVNAMGVGLHSYGFIAGIWTALGIAWACLAVVIAMAGFIKFAEQQRLWSPSDWVRSPAGGSPPRLRPPVHSTR